MTLKTIKFHIKKVFLATGSFIFIYLLLYAYHIVAPAHILFPPKDVRANFYDHSAVFDKFNKGELSKGCNTNSTNKIIIKEGIDILKDITTSILFHVS